MSEINPHKGGTPRRNIFFALFLFEVTFSIKQDED